MGAGEQAQSGGRQRLDKWLFFSRLSKSRALAQKRISDGEVTVNGRRASQPSYGVKAGDKIELITWRGIRQQVHTIVVVAPAGRRGPFEEARSLYEDHGVTLRDDL